MRRGEVWWVEAPGAGRRPYLVLTRDPVIPALTAVVAVPATRTIRGIRTEVRLGLEDGMPEECVLTLDNTSVIRRTFFTERICRLRPEKVAEACQALAFATGC